MNTTEGEYKQRLLFQHITIMLKSLHNFSDKGNITKSDVLRGLDYLYERLSDFLGRELEAWWSENTPAQNQLRNHYQKTTSPEHTNRTQPSSSVTAAFINPDIAESIGISDVESGNLQPTGTLKISKYISTSNVKEKAVSYKFSHISNVETAKYTHLENGSITEIATSSYATESTKSEEFLSSVNDQKIEKQETIKPTISLSSKNYVVEKLRLDLGEHVKERVTISYECKICEVKISSSVGSHISGDTHHINMRKKGSNGVLEIESMESVCEDIVTEYVCLLCLFTVPNPSNMEAHFHHGYGSNLYHDVRVNEDSGFHYCISCSVPIHSMSEVKNHIQGELHENKIKMEEEKDMGTSDIESENFLPTKKVKISKCVPISNVKTKTVDSDIEKNRKIAEFSNIEPTNHTTVQEFMSSSTKSANIPISEESSLSSVNDKRAANQQVKKNAVVKPRIGQNAKSRILEKARPDLGEYVKEITTISYECKMCEVIIPDTVRRHISEKTHKKNMREKGNIEVAETENTEPICQNFEKTYFCVMCSVSSSAKAMKKHICRLPKRRIDKINRKFKWVKNKIFKRKRKSKHLEKFSKTICNIYE